MTNFDGDLAHSIMMKFNLPDEPNEMQLTNIRREIEAVRRTGKTPSDADWSIAVRKYCQGVYLREGVDNSDLNTLLALAIQASKNSKI